MMIRRLLIFVGAAGILAAAYLWLMSPQAPVEAAVQEAPKTAVLVAAKAVANGSRLQTGDMAWKEVSPGDLHPGNIVRGSASDAEFVGTLVRRDYSEGEAFAVSDLIKVAERKNLASTLKAGTRGISIAVDIAQGFSGLIQPGDHVDVILIQMLGDAQVDARRKAVAETILRNIRLIAIDQAIGQQARLPNDALGAEQKTPKTVTLELTERQAEKVFLALRLGTLHLSVRPNESLSDAQEAQEPQAPTWSDEVSTALRGLAPKAAAPKASGSSIESTIRQPPAS